MSLSFFIVSKEVAMFCRALEIDLISEIDCGPNSKTPPIALTGSEGKSLITLKSFNNFFRTSERRCPAADIFFMRRKTSRDSTE